MNHVVISAFRDEFYKVVADENGNILAATRFYDSRLTQGEELSPDDLPFKVYHEVQTYIIKRRSC